MLLFVAFFLIAALWWQIRQVSSQASEFEARRWTDSGRLQTLELKVLQLERRMESAVVTEAPPPQPRQPEPAPEPVAHVTQLPPPLPPLPAQPLPIPPTAPVPEPQAVEPEPVAAIPTIPDTESVFAKMIKPSGGWEELIGGNLLNKLGALLLVIGMALFLSYSFARMGPAGVAFTTLGLSVAILAGGTYLETRERYKLFSRGLIAAGWGSLYFTVYAMHGLPAAQIIDSPLVGVSLMVLVAAGMVLHSLRYRVQALTALAYGCVFAALALSNMNTFVAVALVPLAVSMLFLARRFQWHAMALLGAAATYATFLSRPSTGAPLMAIQSMLLLFWVMFEAFDLLRVAARQPEQATDGFLFGLNALAGLGASAVLWYRMAPDSMWQFCAAAAVFYLASTWVRFFLDGKSLYEFALTLSAFLAGLAIFAGVPGLWISMGMMAEAEILFLAGRYLHLRFATILSWIGFTVSANQLTKWIYAPPQVIWTASVDAWAPALAVLAAIFYLNRYLSKQDRYFGFIASACFGLILGFEMPWRFAGAAWFVFGLLLLELGIRKNLFDFRLQGYGLTALGAVGAALSFLDPLHVRHTWVYSGGAALSLALALRATHSLVSLPEVERRWMRIFGSVGAAVLSAALMTRIAPEQYWGIAMLGVSLALFELALRGWPREMRLPALAVNIAALYRLVFEHALDVQKHPVQSVWIGFAGAALAYYWLTGRLLRNKDIKLPAFRMLAPWCGSAFALVVLWMVLPDAFVPVAIGALAVFAAEIGLAAGAPDLVWHGRTLSVAACASLFLEQPNSITARFGNGLGVSAVQWLVWYRARRQPLPYLHGWIAAGVMAMLIPWVSPAHTLAWWSLFGVALAVASRLLGVRDLGWHSAALALPAALASISGGSAVWEQASAAAWFLLAMALESREEPGLYVRRGYGIGATALAAVALFHQVSGGMLTLSWSLEGISLLALGFIARERILRLSGLTLLLICIGKVFFFDLRNLETIYRILSFIGLGVILLLVSWIYTRFKDQLKKYL